MGKEMLEKIKEHVEMEPYVRLLNIKILELRPGYSVVQMKVMDDYKNLHSNTHGGAIYSLIDVAFGSAANSYGIITVALNVEVNYIRPSNPGDVLIATAKEISRGRNVGTYNITVTNDAGKIVASSQAIGFIMGKKLPFLDQDKE